MVKGIWELVEPQREFLGVIHATIFPLVPAGVTGIVPTGEVFSDRLRPKSRHRT